MKRYHAPKDQTVLEAARENNIGVPHLCFHPASKPSGACRICGVEVTSPTGRQAVMLSCVLKVKHGTGGAHRFSSGQIPPARGLCPVVPHGTPGPPDTELGPQIPGGSAPGTGWVHPVAGCAYGSARRSSRSGP
ncbi:MAG: 2Fe-2S iron-sulfur cluster-binding protein [Desulfotignum sp.]|nr:2Fe-2S iron-sulfur cluster-binding protein [Desulfotignum sp.]